jgi:hypothetical protein
MTDTLFVDSTNNRVGILEASPTVPLEVKGAQGYASSASNLSTTTTKAAAKIRGSNDATTSLFFGSLTNDAEQYIQSANYNGSAADDLVLNPFGGNVLVGTTDTSLFSNNNDANGEGMAYRNGATLDVARYQGECMILNRMNNDGDIAEFRKDGSTVGSIANNGSNLKVNSGAALELSAYNTTRLYVNGGGLRPWADNTYGLGAAGERFTDVWAVDGSINTSDGNEKEQVATLSNAEINAAKAISKLFRTFKWSDRVVVKGDDARTHTGQPLRLTKLLMLFTKMWSLRLC